MQLIVAFTILGCVACFLGGNLVAFNHLSLGFGALALGVGWIAIINAYLFTLARPR